MYAWLLCLVLRGVAGKIHIGLGCGMELLNICGLRNERQLFVIDL